MHAYVCHATYLHIFPLYSKSIICKSEQARNRSVCMYIMLSVICLFTAFCTVDFLDITSYLQSPQFSHKKSIPTRICWEDSIIFDQRHISFKKNRRCTLYWRSTNGKIPSRNLPLKIWMLPSAFYRWTLSLQSLGLCKKNIFPSPPEKGHNIKHTPKNRFKSTPHPPRKKK